MAYINNQQVVTTEPQRRQEVKVDYNGEQIIFEGVYDTLSICLLGLLGFLWFGIIGFLIVVWIGIISWQLYLTRSYIHYHPAGLDWFGCLTWNIPLSYIDDIRPSGFHNICAFIWRGTGFLS